MWDTILTPRLYGDQLRIVSIPGKSFSSVFWILGQVGWKAPQFSLYGWFHTPPIRYTLQRATSHLDFWAESLLLRIETECVIESSSFQGRAKPSMRYNWLRLCSRWSNRIFEKSERTKPDKRKACCRESSQFFQIDQKSLSHSSSK